MPSMTGFGKASAGNDQLELTCEIRSVNNRYLDISIRTPREFSEYEKMIRDTVKENVSRGKVNVFINLNQNQESKVSFSIQNEKIESVYTSLKTVKENLHLTGEISMDHLLAFPDIFTIDVSSIPEKELKSLISKAMNDALISFNRMRQLEGDHLIKDIEERLAKIVLLKEKIVLLAEGNVQREFDKLSKNVFSLIEQNKLAADRLEQEIAIISDRVDITEECVRMDSHIELFKKTLMKNSDTGKKLTFILQEILREVNTINSKNSILEIQHKIIQIKEELEKIREQAQNLE